MEEGRGENPEVENTEMEESDGETVITGIDIHFGKVTSNPSVMIHIYFRYIFIFDIRLG